MRFRRLVAIKDFGYFRGWADTEEAWPHSFGKRTVIFGLNGSGKSTLARLFGSIEKFQQADEARDSRLHGVTVEVMDDATIRKQRCDDPGLPPVLVFGQNYVDSNLREAFTPGGGLAIPLYVLGEASADLDDQLHAIDSQFKELSTNLYELEEKRSFAEKLVEQATKAIKNDVNENLGDYEQRYQKYRFNKNHVKELVEGPAAELDAEELKRARYELQLLLEQIPADRFLPPVPDLNVLAERCAEFSRIDVASEPIERLASDSQLADWVQEGLRRHTAGDRCAFCDNLVDKHRFDELRGHFDDSYQRFQDQATQLGQQLDAADSQLEKTQQVLAELRQGEGLLADEIRERTDALNAFAEEATARIQAGRDLVERRRGTPFRRASWTMPEPMNYEAWTGLEAAAQEENAALAERRSDITSVREAAEARLRAHIAFKHSQLFKTACNSLGKASKDRARADELKEDLKRSRERLVGQIRDEERDGTKLATDLTADLHSYFGHRELKVEYRPDEERPGFAFLRNEEPAVGLSEGERSAVSLLYFLRSLDTEEIAQRLTDTCVVIDDPVSSFDQDAILGAFSFLRRRLQAEDGSLRCEQLVILTHNFQFYRLWKDALANASRDDKEAARDDARNVWALADRKAALLELRAAVDNAELTSRRSSLRELGHRCAGDSEYYLLFHRVCVALESEDANSVLLVGNGARRMLEGFLRWKLPHVRNTTAAINRLGSTNDVPGDVQERVTRALHGASHHEELDITRSTYLGNLVEDLRATLAFMKKIDSSHYDGMCRATGSSPDLGVYARIL